MNYKKAFLGSMALVIIAVVAAGIVYPKNSIAMLIESAKRQPRFYERVELNGKLIGEIWRDGDKLSSKTILDGSIIEMYRWNGKSSFGYAKNGEEEYAMVTSDPEFRVKEFGSDWRNGQPFTIYTPGKGPNLRMRQAAGYEFLTAALSSNLMGFQMEQSGTTVVLKGLAPTYSYTSSLATEYRFDGSSKRLRSVTLTSSSNVYKFSFDYPPTINPNTFDAVEVKGVRACVAQDDQKKWDEALRNKQIKTSFLGGTVEVVGGFRQVGTSNLAIVWREFESNPLLAKAPVFLGPTSIAAARHDPSARILYGNDSRSQALEKIVFGDKVTGGYIMKVNNSVGKTIDVKIPGIKKTQYAEVTDLAGKKRKMYTHKLKYVTFNNLPVTQVFSLKAVMAKSIPNLRRGYTREW